MAKKRVNGKLVLMRDSFLLVLLPAVALLSLAGCPKQGTTPHEEGKPGTGKTAPADAGASEPVTSEPISFAEVRERPCMLHLEADGYFACLSGSDGQCFHYGAACQPASLCMFERSSGLHKICSQVREGRCEAYGSPCEPTDGCMFDVAKGRYRSCESASAGGCKSFTGPCLPRAGV